MVWRHRDVLIALLSSANACGHGSHGDVDARPRDGAAELRWRLETPAVDLAPAEEGYYCSYHRIPDDLGPIQRIEVYGFAGVHDVSLEVVPGPVDDGAIDRVCARSARGALLFSLDGQVGALAFPDDAPLQLGSGLVAVARIHYLNPEDAPARTQAIVSWQGATATPIRTSGLLSGIRTDFTVPIGSSSFETTCKTLSGVALIAAYPISHGLGYRLAISDDTGVLVSTYDWAHPTRASWGMPYLPTGVLTTRCEYLNTSSRVVDGGDRLLVDERCGMSALVVPGTGLSTCSL